MHVVVEVQYDGKIYFLTQRGLVYSKVLFLEYLLHFMNRKLLRNSDGV